MQTSSNPHGPAKKLPDTWPVAGSTSYYTLLHCSDAVRDNVRSTLDLINTISSVLVNVSEPTVAEQKVHWWHEELARLAKGEARHPATTGWFKQHTRQFEDNSREALYAIKATIPQWLNILSCNANERFSNATDDVTFRQRIEEDYSARLRLLAHSIDVPYQLSAAAVAAAVAFPDTPAARNIIIGLGLCHRLRRFNQLQSGGVMVWPDNFYQQHDLQPETLHDDDKRNQLLEMFDRITEDAVQALTRGLADLPAPTSQLSDSSIAVLTAANLRQQQMKMWQRNRPDLLRQYQGLTPFRKSLVTWRTRRKLTLLQKRLQK